MKLILFSLVLLALAANVLAQSPVRSENDPATTIHTAFRSFIDAENAKDTLAVHRMLWDSPNMVFAPFGKKDSGNYLGYWGAGNAMSHFSRLYALGIHLEPDYQTERIAFLSPDVAQLFIPAKISFPDRTPLSFLVITYWVKVKHDWRLASDIAIPLGN